MKEELKNKIKEEIKDTAMMIGMGLLEVSVAVLLTILMIYLLGI